MLRRRFTYSNVVATLALVFAMSGGAYAASKFLITSTKQIKPSVLSSLKGKAGANGVAGAQGPAGAVGPAGTAGGVGPQGPAGTPGTNGEPGPEGKAGKNGANGKEGSPWTDGGTLPKGATETGVWQMGPMPESEGFGRTTVSFTIPLAAPIATANVHIFRGTSIPKPGCTGTVVGENVTDLKAESGNFCGWIQQFSGGSPTATVGAADIENEMEPGVGISGAQLGLSGALKGLEEAHGTWAVTG